MRNRVNVVLEAVMKRLLSENPEAVTPGVFAPKDAIGTAKPARTDYVIAREFPIKVTQEVAVALNLSTAEIAEALENNGVLEGEWEVVLDLNPSYSPGTPGRLHGHPDTWHPGDPEEFEVDDYAVDGILLYGAKKVAVLSPGDAAQLKGILGDLTEDEIDRFREQYIENLPEPDYDDGYYGDY